MEGAKLAAIRRRRLRNCIWLSSNTERNLPNFDNLCVILCILFSSRACNWKIHPALRLPDSDKEINLRYATNVLDLTGRWKHRCRCAGNLFATIPHTFAFGLRENLNEKREKHVQKNISGPDYGGFKLFAGPQFGDLCGRTWDASNERSVHARCRFHSVQAKHSFLQFLRNIKRMGQAERGWNRGPNLQFVFSFNVLMA